MSMPMQKLPRISSVNDRFDTYQIIEDALSDPESAALDPKHPYHEQAVKSLRRLQLQIINPDKPCISELDLKRLNLPRSKAEQMEFNRKVHGSAIGNRPKVTELDRIISVFIGIDPKTNKPVYQQMTEEQYLECKAEETDDDFPCEECGEDYDFCDVSSIN